MLKEKPKRTGRTRVPILLAYLAGVVTGVALGLIVPGLMTSPEIPPAQIGSFSGRDESLPILDIALSPDGHTVAVAVQEADGTASIYLRDIQGTLLTSGVIDLASHIPIVGDIEFTSDGSRLVAASDGNSSNHTVLSINVADKTSWEFTGEYVSVSGSLMAIASGDVLTFYDARTGELIGQEQNVESLSQIAISPKLNLVATMVLPSNGNSEVRFLPVPPNTSTGYPPENFLPDGIFQDIVFSPQGDRIVAAVEDRLLMHNLELDGATFGSQQNNIGTIHRLAVVNDWLAVAGEYGVKTLHYETRSGWTTLQWMEKVTLSGHASTVTGLAFLNDGQHLLTGGRDGKLLLWDFANNILVWGIGS